MNAKQKKIMRKFNNGDICGTKAMLAFEMAAGHRKKMPEKVSEEAGRAGGSSRSKDYQKAERDILNLLLERELTSSEIMGDSGTQINTVRDRLLRMKRKGLVQSNKMKNEGRGGWYYLWTLA